MPVFDRIRKLALGNNTGRSKYFDAEYYLAANPDVAASGVDPYKHYMSTGWREGRNPSASFNTLYYRQVNMADVAEPQNPLLHFRATGESKTLTIAPGSDEEYIALQKRTIANRFDEYYYRSRCDNIPPGMSALDHYFSIGGREGYDPASDFSVAYHLLTHSYVAGLKVDPFFHHVVTAGPAARDATPTAAQLAYADRTAIFKTIEPKFDAAFYLRGNADVRAVGAPPVIHYLDHGWREGRNPTPQFWTSYYLRTNDDVKASGINPFYHYLVSGQKERRKPNPIGLGLFPAPVAPSDEAWEKVAPAKDIADARVTVIVPVYRGHDKSLAAIHSVLAHRQQARFNLLVVNDCSPEPALTAKLRELHAAGLFGYIENERNLGFVGSINRALDERPALDVVLLNADAVVYGNWLDRLLAHADRDAAIATVTPFSNNAMICSYPEVNRNNLLALEISPEEIDRFAAAANRGGGSTIPTGVGFCFYMRRSAIDRIGKFDFESFGRGYGEENDFCMRASKAGFKNFFAYDVFVYHTGEVSFAGFAAAASEEGQAALLKKHPDYRLRVERYVAADPAREARARLDLYRLAKAIGPGVAVFVTHSWSGGIATHARDLAGRLAEADIRVVYLYAGNEGGSADIAIGGPRDLPVYTPNVEKISVLKYPDLIGEFLSWLQPRMIHVHSLAGLTWQASERIMSVVRQSGTPYFYTAHDFSSLCHRNHLVDNEGIYCGQPATDVCRRCIRADIEYRDVVDPDQRRDVYGTFLRGADGVFVPSADTASRLTRVFAGLTPTIRPHEEFLPRTAWVTTPHRFGPPLRIAAIGALGPHKGTGVLHDLALDAKQRNLPIEFTIVGYSHMTDRFRELDVRETGRYDSEADAMRHLRDRQPLLALFPSIWPETYLYTLSLALAMGIPPVVFDLGAQAERLRAAGIGRVLDPGLVAHPGRLNDFLLALPLEDMWRNRHPPAFAFYADILKDYYAKDARPAAQRQSGSVAR